MQLKAKWFHIASKCDCTFPTESSTGILTRNARLPALSIQMAFSSSKQNHTSTSVHPLPCRQPTWILQRLIYTGCILRICLHSRSPGRKRFGNIQNICQPTCAINETEKKEWIHWELPQWIQKFCRITQVETTAPNIQSTRSHSQHQIRSCTLQFALTCTICWRNQCKIFSYCYKTSGISKTKLSNSPLTL